MDIIERLRNGICTYTSALYGSGNVNLIATNNMLKEAADEIERAFAERDEAKNQLDSALHSIDVLEKRLRALTTWHRIDDPDNPPPKDGTIILAIIYGDPWLVYDDDGDWFTDTGDIIGFPTHWRPFPPLPEVK